MGEPWVPPRKVSRCGRRSPRARRGRGRSSPRRTAAPAETSRLRRSIPPAVPATSAQTMSLVSAISTNVSPRTASWLRVEPSGSTNCGRKARKNSAVFGFSTLTTTPLRYVRPSVVSACRPSDPLLAAQQRADPEVHEVGGAEELDRGERLRRCGQERGEADHGGRDMEEAAGRDAERRDDARSSAPRDALRDDVEHGGAGHDGERQRGGGEDGEGSGVWDHRTTWGNPWFGHGGTPGSPMNPLLKKRRGNAGKTWFPPRDNPWFPHEPPPPVHLPAGLPWPSGRRSRPPASTVDVTTIVFEQGEQLRLLRIIGSAPRPCAGRRE